MEARGMETQEGRVLKRGLKRRHLTMIAIGGSIGTGLFLAMGGTIRDAGPGGAMVAYAVMGIVVYFMMTALGEMATRLPIPGAFTSYADRFIDKAWGFTNGWSYWFGSAMTDRRGDHYQVLVSKFQFVPLGDVVPSGPAGDQPLYCKGIR